MGLGSSTTTVQLQVPPDQAFQRVERAGNAVGKVVESLPTVGRVVVKARFGLQSVKVRVAVTGGEGVSTVTFDGFGDDIWGGGARKVIDRLIRELA